MIITIKDEGKDRYTLESDHEILGRQYDNEAESITVIFPQYEIDKGSKCYLIATNSGDTVDVIEVQNNTPLLIQNTLTKYSCVNIGFSFQFDNYIKNSEIQQFKTLPAQKPTDFVPVTPEQERKFNKLYEKAFTYVTWKEGTNNVMVFKNLDGEIVKELNLSPFMQEQADLAEQDNTKETFVKNKELKYLAEDETHRTVTDTEKQTWNNKSDFSGDYNDLTNKPTIPSALSELSEDTTHRVVTDTEKLRWNNLVANLDLSLNTTTYVLSIQLKDYQGNNIGEVKTVDLPIDSLILSATYYDTYTYEGVTYNKVIVIMLTTTSVPTIIPVADLVSGLQPLLTAGAGITLNNNVISVTDPIPSHIPADTGKVLTVDNGNLVWRYTPDEVVTFTKINSGGTFTVDSADWVSAMNNDKAILRVTDGTNYYVLYKEKYDATTVYFEGSGKLGKFIKDGVNYSGTFESISNGITPATQTNLGGVYMWQDANGTHIWNIDPQAQNLDIETNEDNSQSYIFKTMNYTTTTNQDGSTNYIIGGNN